MILEKDYSEKLLLHEHHVINGTAGRRLSEKYGLKVYLCLRHHEIEKESVHMNAEIAKILKQAAEITFIKRYSADMYRQVFGKSFLDDVPDDRLENWLKPKQKASGPIVGLRFVDTGLDSIDW